MSLSSFEKAAENWFKSLFSGFTKVESFVETESADPLVVAGTQAAKTIVSAELTKAGVPVGTIEKVGTAILTGLANVSAAVPTVKAIATDVTSGLQLAGTATADVTAAVNEIRGIAASHATSPAQPTA